MAYYFSIYIEIFKKSREEKPVFIDKLEMFCFTLSTTYM